MHQIQGHIRAPERDSAVSAEAFSLKSRSSYEVLRQLASSSEPITTDGSSADAEFANRLLRELTSSIQDILTERQAKAKDAFRQAVREFETEVLPGLTSDLWPAYGSGAAQDLQEVLKCAIRDDLVTPFLRGSAAAVFTLLEYIDRGKSLERIYPGAGVLLGFDAMHKLESIFYEREPDDVLNVLSRRGFSINADVRGAFEAMACSIKGHGRLHDRVRSSAPGKQRLAAAFLSLPAIASRFSSEAIEETLRYLAPRRDPFFEKEGDEQAKALPRTSIDFGCDLLSGLQGALSREELSTASELIQSREFAFAARLNAGNFDRVVRHVQAFCSAVKNPYGESPESIGKECIHSLCQELKCYRDDFILWRFRFSKGAAHAIRRFEAALASENAATVGLKGIDWLSCLFRGGFTPPDPDGERLDLCIKEPRFLELGAMIRRDSPDLLPILTDISTSDRESRYLSRSELEPLRLFLLGHAAALLATHPSALGRPNVVRWVSLNVADLQSFGGLPVKQSFAKILLTHFAFGDRRLGVGVKFDLGAILAASFVPEKGAHFLSALNGWITGPAGIVGVTTEQSCAQRRWLKGYIEECFTKSPKLLYQEVGKFSNAAYEYTKRSFPYSASFSLQLAGYSHQDIGNLVGTWKLDNLLKNVDKWKISLAKPSIRLPVKYLLEMADGCHFKLIGTLADFLSKSPVSLWKERIGAEHFNELFHLVFLDCEFEFSFCALDSYFDEKSRLLTTLVHSQRASSTTVLANASIKQSLSPEKINAAIEARRPAIRLAMYTDRVNYNNIDPLHAHILSEEIELLRFQPECDLPKVLRSADAYLAANSVQAPHRTYPLKSVAVSSIKRLEPSLSPVSGADRILIKHALLFRVASEFATGDTSYVHLHGSSPHDAAAAIGSPLGQFFIACSRSSYERREMGAIFDKLFDMEVSDNPEVDFSMSPSIIEVFRLNPNTLARYVERLVDALDGGFSDNIELTYRNKPLAKALAKELKLDVLMAELRSHYDAGLECKPGPKNIEVTFMPTIGWLMEVSGAISGTCVGKLSNIAQTYTEGVFVPFVVKGDPPHFSGGAFVFEGVLAKGEKVMVIRGFNPRTYLLNNVAAGELFETFADYVAEMGRACGATRVVLPQADFWHNPATTRPDVHFYFQDEYMKRARMKLGECQVRNFNNFGVDFVVEVRKIHP